MRILSSIPSPGISYFDVGPLRIHFYAVFILIGIAVAILIGNRRLVDRGAEKWVVLDIALWTVPFGIIGGRLFHVLTHATDYFGPGKSAMEIFAVWNGGLAIFGALILGAFGAFVGCYQSGIKFLSFLDAIAPGVILAQAIGRWGNYFNQELFGKPTDLPWALEIARPNPAIPTGLPESATFHPTFAYEMLWNIAAFAVLVFLDKRLDLRWGRLFALYLAVYSVGRFWIEGLRIDPSDVYFGLRTNQWSAVLTLAVGIAIFLWSRRRHTGVETTVLSDKKIAAAADEKAVLG
jgi:prolipoprotein diacylglyceryl transferase